MWKSLLGERMTFLLLKKIEFGRIEQGNGCILSEWVSEGVAFSSEREKCGNTKGGSECKARETAWNFKRETGFVFGRRLLSAKCAMRAL